MEGFCQAGMIKREKARELRVQWSWNLNTARGKQGLEEEREVETQEREVVSSMPCVPQWVEGLLGLGAKRDLMERKETVSEGGHETVVR